MANLTVSPDGSRLAFSLEVFPDCPTLACTKERLDAKAKEQGLGGSSTRGTRLLPPLGHLERRPPLHLFVLPAAGGEPVDADAAAWTPTPRPSPSAAPRSSPSRPTAARSSSPPATWAARGALVHRLRPLPGAGGRLAAAAEPDRRQPAPWDTQPVFSPDGKTLAYLAMARPASRPTASASCCATWPTGTRAHAGRGLGPLADGLVVLARRPDALRHGRGHRPGAALRHRRRRPARSTQAGRRGARPRRRTWRATGLVFGRDDLRSPAELYTVRPRRLGADPDHPRQRATRSRRRGWASPSSSRFTGGGRRHGLRLGRQAGRLRAGQEVPAGLPHPRRPAGLLRQRVPLPLEPADLRRRRLRGGDDRLPRLDRLRPGLHRRHPQGLGRQAAGGPAEGAGRRARSATPGSTATAPARSAPPTAAT